MSKDDPEGFFQWNYERAKKKEPDAAKELLQGFCEAHEEGKQLPTPIAKYLYMAFSSYLAEETTIERALLLTKPATRPRGRYAADPLRVVSFLYLLIKREKLGKKAAKAEVARRLHVPTRNIERYAKEWRGLEQLTVEALERLSDIAKNSRH